MQKRYGWGGLFVLMGLLIAIGPQTFIRVCPSDGDMVMACHYTAQTELADGMLIALSGGMLALQTSRAAQSAISLLLLQDGVVTILVPYGLIGVCSGAHMHCHAVTRPALTLLGAAVVVAAGIGLIFYQKKELKSHEPQAADDR